MSRFHMPRSRHDVNLWAIPLQMSLGAVLLFALTMIPDTLAAFQVIHLPFWFTMGGIDDARAILSAMLGCVSTVLALIFSVALLMLSMVATLFGPRLLYRFVQDWVTQVTIGLFMGAFIYVFLVFLVTHQDATSTFIPQVSLITSWCVVLTAFAFLVYYSHRIAVSIQNPDAVARIVDDVRRVRHLTGLRAPGAGRGEPVQAERIQRQMAEGGIVPSPTSGYMQEVAHHELVAAATTASAVVHLLFRPGQFVLQGEPLACVWPASQRAALAVRIPQHVRIRASPRPDAGQRIWYRADRRDCHSCVESSDQRYLYRPRMRRLARRGPGHPGRGATGRRLLVRHQWPFALAGAYVAGDAPRQAGLRSNPPGGSGQPRDPDSPVDDHRAYRPPIAARGGAHRLDGAGHRYLGDRDVAKPGHDGPRGHRSHLAEDAGGVHRAARSGASRCLQ